MKCRIMLLMVKNIWWSIDVMEGDKTISYELVEKVNTYFDENRDLGFCR